MNGPRAPRASRVVVVLAWALAVLVAGAVTSWAVTVISGEQGPARDRVLAASQVTDELAAQRSVSSTATTSPVAPSSSSPAAVPAPEPSDDPSPTASALPPATPPAAPPTRTPAAPLPAPSTAPTEIARTWDVTGGQVGASCRGSVLSLLYATPVDGWTVEVKHAGSDGLEVAFRQNDAETTVHATCVRGVPTQETDRD